MELLDRPESKKQLPLDFEINGRSGKDVLVADDLGIIIGDKVILDGAIEENLVPEDTNLDTEKHIIDVINDWAKNRGKYRKGENRNPINDKRNKKEGD